MLLYSAATRAPKKASLVFTASKQRHGAQRQHENTLDGQRITTPPPHRGRIFNRGVADCAALYVIVPEMRRSFVPGRGERGA